MFGQNRDQLRTFFFSSWKKRLGGEPMQPLEQLVAGIITQHPEYRALIESGDSQVEFSPDSGQNNPFLHMAMHISLAEQLGADRPAGIRAIHQALAHRRGDAHQAEHEMMECLGLALWEAQRSKRMPDELAYLECLKKLA